MIADDQLAVCKRFGVDPVEAAGDLKAGVSRGVSEGVYPIHGLRHRPERDTTGWYIWSGDVLSDEADFFAPLHVSHLAEIRPEVLPYLALPPGWRFLLAPDHEDVWPDDSLLLNV